MSTKRQSKHLRFTREDIEILERLQHYYGTSSENETIRMALRAAQREITPPITPRKERPSYPPGFSQGFYGPDG